MLKVRKGQNWPLDGQQMEILQSLTHFFMLPEEPVESLVVTLKQLCGKQVINCLFRLQSIANYSR